MAESAAPLDIAQLVTDHHQTLYRYAYRLTGVAADAEDLTQQTYLIAQQKLSQVRDAQCARSWLFTVLRNCYLKSRRQRTNLPATDAEVDVNAIPETLAIDALGELAVDSEQLQRAIDELADDFKLVVLMFYFEYRTYREIGEVLEIPLGTVMSRLARAKSHLRAALGWTERKESSRADGVVGPRGERQWKTATR